MVRAGYSARHDATGARCARRRGRSIIIQKPYRLLMSEGKTRAYATQEARDRNAQRLADETGAGVGLESWGDGDWWLEGVVQPQVAESPAGSRA